MENQGDSCTESLASNKHYHTFFTLPTNSSHSSHSSHPNLPFLPSEIWSHIVRISNLSIEDAKNLRLVSKEITLLPSCVPVPFTFSIDRMCLNGSFEAIQWVMSDKNAAIFMSMRTINWAALNGRLDMLKWFYRTNIRRYKRGFEKIQWDSAFNCATKGNHIAVVEWINEMRCHNDLSQSQSKQAQQEHQPTPLKSDQDNTLLQHTLTKVLENAATNGNRWMIEWVMEKNNITCPLPISCFFTAISNGHLDLSKWLYERVDRSFLEDNENNENENTIMNHGNTFSFNRDLVIIRKHMGVYEWLCEKDLVDYQRWAVIATQYGYLDILKDICKRDEQSNLDLIWLIDVAIMNCQLHIVKWMHAFFKIDIDETRMELCKGFIMSTEFLIWMIKKFVEYERDKREDFMRTTIPVPCPFPFPTQHSNVNNESHFDTEEQSVIGFIAPQKNPVPLAQEAIDLIVCNLIATSGDIGVMSWYKHLRENKIGIGNSDFQTSNADPEFDSNEASASAFTSQNDDYSTHEDSTSESNDDYHPTPSQSQQYSTIPPYPSPHPSPPVQTFDIPIETLHTAHVYGHVYFIRFLLEAYGIEEKCINFEGYILIDFVIDEFCEIDMLNYWVTLCKRNEKKVLYSSNAIDKAAKYGRVDIIEWILENEKILNLIDIPIVADWNAEIVNINEDGNDMEFDDNIVLVIQLEVNQIQENDDDPLEPLEATIPPPLPLPPPLSLPPPPSYTCRAMNDAAQNGHLHVLKYLHERLGRENCLCSHKAMDRAAGNGHHNCVQWLHQNRDEGCSPRAIENALQNGHIDMVQWLNKYRPEACYRENVLAHISSSLMNDEDIDSYKDWVIKNCKKK